MLPALENVVQESELLNDYNIKDADAGFDDPFCAGGTITPVPKLPLLLTK